MFNHIQYSPDFLPENKPVLHVSRYQSVIHLQVSLDVYRKNGSRAGLPWKTNRPSNKKIYVHSTHIHKQRNRPTTAGRRGCSQQTKPGIRAGTVQSRPQAAEYFCPPLPCRCVSVEAVLAGGTLNVVDIIRTYMGRGLVFNVACGLANQSGGGWAVSHSQRLDDSKAKQQQLRNLNAYYDQAGASKFTLLVVAPTIATPSPLQIFDRLKTKQKTKIHRNPTLKIN